MRYTQLINEETVMLKLGIVMPYVRTEKREDNSTFYSIVDHSHTSYQSTTNNPKERTLVRTYRV